MQSLSFSQLNLRRNPFGEFSADERTQLANVDVEAAIAHLQSGTNKSAPVLQIVGEKGFGKSTHLLSIGASFTKSAYVHIAEGERGRIPAEGEPLLIDEAQRLTVWQRIRLFRSRRTLVLGTHRDFTRELCRAGRIVLTLAADRHTTPERVAEILNARILAVRRGDGPIPFVTIPTALRLYEQFGPDLRSIQHSMYEVFQQLGSVQDV